MPDLKKLIFVCNTSWSAYKFRLTLIRQLVSRGNQVYILAPADRHSEWLRNEKGVVFIPLYHFKATSLSPFADRKLYLELRNHYLQIRPHLIFHYTIKANIYGTLAAAKTNCPSISVVTGLGYTFLNNLWMRKIVSSMYRFALKKANETWVLNKEDRAYFIEKKITPPEKTFILPGEGIDTDLFNAPANTEIKPALSFLLIARIIKEKGIEEYARAAAILKQKGYAVECQLVGFYDYKNPSAIPYKKFSGWVNSGMIVYLGATDHIIPFIEKADCIVLPSYREGLPLSLLEGASMNRPLIAADTAGCREIVEHGKNGFLCQPKDAEGLAAAMESFYHLSPADRIKMGAEARKIAVSRFAQEIVYAHYFSRINQYARAHTEKAIPIINTISG